MSKKLYIVGAGSVGGHVASNFEMYGLDYELTGFFDDDKRKIGNQLFGYPVLGPSDAVLELENAAVIIGIAFPVAKKNIVDRCSSNQTLEFPTLVAPGAWISKGCNVGKGSIIYPGCSVNYGTTIGDFVVMNMNCALGHDCTIGDFSSLAPGVNLAGHTYTGEAVEMGIGSSTRQNVKIGRGSVIGGQSMVTKDVPEFEIWGGVPAGLIRKIESTL